MPPSRAGLLTLVQLSLFTGDAYSEALPDPPVGPTSANAVPEAASRLRTDPGRLATWRHVVPPSWVAHTSGPKAQPLFASANRSVCTPWVGTIELIRKVRTVAGASTERQVRPPSV